MCRLAALALVFAIQATALNEELTLSGFRIVLEKKEASERIAFFNRHLQGINKRIGELKQRQPEHPSLFGLLRTRNLLTPLQTMLGDINPESCRLAAHEIEFMLGFGEAGNSPQQELSTMREIQDQFCKGEDL